MTDQTIPADKVRETLDFYKFATLGLAVPFRDTEVYKSLASLIPAPPLPTLADMTPEERDACQWMQATYIDSFHDGPGDHVITSTEGNYCRLLRKYDGYGFEVKDCTRVIPHPDLPKMVWPSGDAPTIAKHENVAPDQVVSKDVCNKEPQTAEEFKQMVDDTIEEEYGTPKHDPRPGEAWLVMDDEGIEFKGVLDNSESWMGAEPDGKPRSPSIDRCTPIARLVPETPRKVLVTEEDYRDAPVGTVITYPAFFDDGVESDWIDTAVKYGDGHWRSTGSVGYDDTNGLSGIPRVVLWEPEA